ncbi:apolipoprotein D-like [Belonocnema kinseyi]|uniref:apolipoprotein D-like n=1 Tax=Belonocnema kinseyi TaxID=2817044 RepID=UPI00143D8DE7|nr:apolipoprotein D-like [Belonocnema kinseyi]
MDREDWIAAARWLENNQPCGDVTPMEEFDPKQERHKGHWYVVATYPVGSNLKGKCISQHFRPQEDGSVKLLTKVVEVKTEKIRTYKGTAKFVENEAKFIEIYEDVEYEEEWILDTDYENYAIHFACADLSPYKVNNVWILAKTTSVEEEVLKKAHKVLRDNKLSIETLEVVDCESCPKEKKKY